MTSPLEGLVISQSLSEQKSEEVLDIVVGVSSPLAPIEGSKTALRIAFRPPQMLSEGISISV